jgi:thiol-disulfide isomerase/thioredoxin
MSEHEDAQRQQVKRQSLQKIGLMAAAVGAGVAGSAFWRSRERAAERVPSLAPSAEAAAGEAGLWALRLPSASGATIDFSAFRAKPLLVNFWATWCPPCVTEMPLLQRFYQEVSPKGWQIVGIAVDQLPNVSKFIEREKITFPIGIAGMEAIALSKALGNLAGGLPFTLVFGSGGVLVQRKLGEVKAADLALWRQIT